MTRLSPTLLLFAGALLGAPANAAAAAATASSAEVEAGRRIYQEGVLVSGAPLVAVTAARVELAGRPAACVNCHRRSGLRSVEGGRIIASITGKALARPLRAVHRARPAYNAETFARALRQGIDPAGSALDPLMPRFDLGSADLRALGAYLDDLSSRPVAGVDADRLHFATVVAEGVDPLARESMLGVLRAYAAVKSDQKRRADVRWAWPEALGHYHDGEPVFRALLQSRAKAKRMGRGVLAVDRAPREWVLHVWELAGPPATWAAQMDAHYRRQPVFALISGLIPGPWQPIHDYCASRELPCLYPNTDLPPASTAYTNLYFTAGMALEAKVLDRHLRDLGHDAEVIQVYRAGDRGETAAAVLRQMGAATRPIKDRALAGDEPLSPATWNGLRSRDRAAVHVLWLDGRDLAALGPPPADLGGAFLSSNLSGNTPLPDAWAARAQVVHPYDLRAVPGWLPPAIRAWLRDQGLKPGDLRIQANSFAAAAFLDAAVTMLGDDFSRDYLLEKFEDMLEKGLPDSLYPRASLGPGQRFASKGAYIAKPGAAAWVPLTDWIVP